MSNEFDPYSKVNRSGQELYLAIRARIGNELKAQRLARDMRQQDMAALLGCSVAQVGLIEDIRRTDYNPRLTTLLAMCAALEISWEQLTGDPMR